MEDSGDRFDVIVVGAGIMGSCAAYEAAKRGQRVLLLERFDFLHHLGSSHGESRTIRSTYAEPYYPPMVLDAFRLWDEAESCAGYRVLTRTKHHLDMGPKDCKSLRAVISSCDINSLEYQILDGAEVALKFPFRLPEGWIGVVTETGGVIKPTKAVAMFQALSAGRGVVLKDRMEVVKIDREGGGGVRVETAGGERFYGNKCVVAVGAWTKKMVEEVTGRALPIQPLNITVCYWRVKEGYERAFTTEGGFPTFASHGNPHVFGTPSMEYPGLVKILLDGGEPCDPERREWELSSSVSPVAEWIKLVLPGCVEADGEPVARQPCMYSMTPDENYIIDFLGGEFGKDVVVAGGFSGHGFKMGPLIGKILAEMAVDGEAKGVDMNYFRIGRFDDHPKGNPKDYGE